jgi:hypothetical protein
MRNLAMTITACRDATSAHVPCPARQVVLDNGVRRATIAKGLAYSA